MPADGVCGNRLSYVCGCKAVSGIDGYLLSSKKVMIISGEGVAA